MKLSVDLKCGYSAQHYFLAVDDVMLTWVLCVTFALKQNNLIATVECSVWLVLSNLSGTILHVNNHSYNQAVKWHLNISGINRPISREYRWTFYATIFRLCSN